MMTFPVLWRFALDIVSSAADIDSRSTCEVLQRKLTQIRDLQGFTKHCCDGTPVRFGSSFGCTARSSDFRSHIDHARSKGGRLGGLPAFLHDCADATLSPRVQDVSGKRQVLARQVSRKSGAKVGKALRQRVFYLRSSFCSLRNGVLAMLRTTGQTAPAPPLPPGLRRSSLAAADVAIANRAIAAATSVARAPSCARTCQAEKCWSQCFM